MARRQANHTPPRAQPRSGQHKPPKSVRQNLTETRSVKDRGKANPLRGLLRARPPYVRPTRPDYQIPHHKSGTHTPEGQDHAPPKYAVPTPPALQMSHHRSDRYTQAEVEVEVGAAPGSGVRGQAPGSRVKVRLRYPTRSSGNTYNQRAGGGNTPPQENISPTATMTSSRARHSLHAPLSCTCQRLPLPIYKPISLQLTTDERPAPIPRASFSHS